MKKILILLVLILSGCTPKLYLDVFNNTRFDLFIGGIESVAIESGKNGRVKILSSTRSIDLNTSEKSYEYSIRVSNIPGEFIVAGLVHKLKLQIQPTFEVYLLKPKCEFPVNDFSELEQPNGFPLVPASSL